MAPISVFTDYLFPCLAGKLYLQRKCMDVGARSNLLVYFSVQRKLKVSLSDTPLWGIQIPPPLPLKRKIILLIISMSLVRVPISPQAHKPPRHWGNQLYFTGGLGWANTIKTGSVSLHTGKADGGRTELDPAVWNFKLNQFGALLVPRARLSLKWRGQEQWALYSWAGFAQVGEWYATFSYTSWTDRGRGIGSLWSRFLECSPGEWKIRTTACFPGPCQCCTHGLKLALRWSGSCVDRLGLSRK